MDRDAIALFRELADRSPSDREAYYVRQNVPAALRAEVESLLRFDGDTADSIPGYVAAAAEGVLRGNPLMPGARLGPYEVLALAGAGGMGEVYKARDTRLGRTVAIKVLPAHVASDSDLKQRFEREAKILAALSHPHICPVFDVGHQADTDFLVMEYLKGETLADRLAKGPLPVDQGLRYAIQIADALAIAHRAGIVHRDLKPSNIMLTTSGASLLDFGLAKPTRPTHGTNLSRLPTTPPITERGTILGTFQYMAPEQLEGRAADARSDLFAFGAVIYEMLTGKKAFEGRSRVSVIAAIMTAEPPPISATKPLTPPALDHVVKICLAKDPEERWQSAADVVRQLTWIAGGGAAVPVRRAATRRWTAIGAVVGVVILAMLGVIAMLNSKPAPLAPTVRFDIPVNAAPPIQPMAISPDGRQIAFVGSPDSNHFALWLRPLDALDAKMIRGTETLRAFVSPAFSPDGRSIAFVADGKLKRIDVTGESAATLTPLDSQIGGIAWSRDDVILFASNEHGLRRVPASGGEVVSVTERDASLDEIYHDCPAFLPDGRRFIYLAYSEAKPENRAVYVGSLDSKARTRLMSSDSCAAYAAPGFLLFSRGRTIMARPFDAQALEFTGEAVAIADDVATFSNDEYAAFAVSDAGTLIYRKVGVPDTTRSLVWIDRNGKVSEPIGAPIQSGTPVVRLSPDNRFIVFSTSVDGRPDDIWTHDLQRNIRLRLTADQSTDHLPVWSPDGTQVMFDSHRSSKGSAIYQVPANGAVDGRLFFQPEANLLNGVNDWSRDGRFLVLQQSSATGAPRWSLWGLPLFGNRKPFVYKTSAGDNIGGRLSPNGRWLAYTTTESGTSQVVVQPFPDPSGGKWQVSGTGGSNPIWRRDGRELFYINSTRDLVAVEVKVESAFAIGQSATLFRTAVVLGTPGFPYDVTADGTRFVVAIPSGNTTPPITTILNWSSLMKSD